MQQLSNEELATKIKAGDSALMHQLWEKCYGFIRQQAIRWSIAWGSRPDFDADDLTQAGYIALCEAVRDYENDKGRFLGFLLFYLKTEFAKVAGCRTTSQAKDPINSAVSLDSPICNDGENETALGDTIPVSESGFDDIERDVFNQQLAAVLDQAMNELSEKQRRTIELYYLHGMKYAQIAEILHCTSSYNQQCTRDGLRKMRDGAYAPILSEMLYGDRNYYRHTGFYSWKYSGSSSPEWELMKKEKRTWQKIRHCVDRLGMSVDQTRQLFNS